MKLCGKIVRERIAGMRNDEEPVKPCLKARRRLGRR
jgi:hypothetical protein